MQDKYSAQHAEIARQIRLAKRRMFKAHREGAPLLEAKDAFLMDLNKVITEQHLNAKVKSEVARIVGHEPNPVKHEHASPSRERHDLADAVAEIISNESAPPRLRDPIVNYIADAPDPEHSSMLAEAVAAQAAILADHAESETEETDADLEAARSECEALARECVQWGERDQQLALVTLLHRIANADSDACDFAYAAELVAFRACDALVDDAIKFTLEAKGDTA